MWFKTFLVTTNIYVCVCVCVCFFFFKLSAIHNPHFGGASFWMVEIHMYADHAIFFLFVGDGEV